MLLAEAVAIGLCGASKAKAWRLLRLLWLLLGGAEAEGVACHWSSRTEIEAARWWLGLGVLLSVTEWVGSSLLVVVLAEAEAAC